MLLKLGSLFVVLRSFEGEDGLCGSLMSGRRVVEPSVGLVGDDLPAVFLLRRSSKPADQV